MRCHARYIQIENKQKSMRRTHMRNDGVLGSPFKPCSIRRFIGALLLKVFFEGGRIIIQCNVVFEPCAKKVRMRILTAKLWKSMKVRKSLEGIVGSGTRRYLLYPFRSV